LEFFFLFFFLLLEISFDSIVWIALKVENTIITSRFHCEFTLVQRFDWLAASGYESNRTGLPILAVFSAVFLLMFAFPSP
jgi:hypothetical protein